jgi:hypothetical protein
MAKRLIGAGFAVRGADPSDEARANLAAADGKAFSNTRDAVAGASAVITMLPNGPPFGGSSDLFRTVGCWTWSISLGDSGEWTTSSKSD